MEIDWDKITWDGFEEFCWHLLEANGFQNLMWLGKSGDRGRDITATKNEQPFAGFEDQRTWIIQCKRHKKSPSPSDLDKSITWAKTHNPDYFLLIVPCRISPGTRDWLEGQRSMVPFRIMVLDKPHIESQLLKHSEELSPYLPPKIQEAVRKYIPTREHVPAKTTMITQPPWTVHMKVVREQAIDPWIDLLHGVDRGTVIIGGVTTVESSTMASLSVNHKIAATIPKDPVFKYSKELFQHLSTGYLKQHKNWINLKEDYGNYIKEGKSVFEAIDGKLTVDVSRETSLDTYNLRGPPPNEYFVPKYLSYIIYRDLYTRILYGRKLFGEDLQVNEDKKKTGLFYVSKGAFSRLAQGKKWQCEKISAIVAELEQDKQLNQLMESHVSKRKKLDNRLTKFIEFLEKLSKFIENQKRIQGDCDMCPERTEN